MDTSPACYEPGMDTTLLMHLSRSVSENLARLLPPFYLTANRGK